MGSSPKMVRSCPSCFQGIFGGGEGGGAGVISLTEARVIREEGTKFKNVLP